MKITVITGSPRKHGNSFAMTDAFIREAETHMENIKSLDPLLYSKLTHQKNIRIK